MSDLENMKTVELSMDEMSKAAGGYERPPEKKGFIIYQIQPGDALGLIAKTFHTTVPELMSWNPQIVDKNLIYAGDYLYIREKK